MTAKFSLFRLILRSLRFHWRSHLAVASGTAVATIVLTGALLVGGSLKKTLHTLVDKRLGSTHHILISHQGFFSAALADSFATALNSKTAPIIQRIATAANDGGKKRAHNVTLIGIDERFWAMGPSGTKNVVIGDGEALINEALALKLSLSPGDVIIAKFDRGNLLPLETPFSGGERNRESLRLRISALVAEDHFGDFSLKTEHFSVYNIFVPRNTLATACKKPKSATTILIGESSDTTMRQVLDRAWSLTDAGIHVRKVLQDRYIEIHADRIFFDTALTSSMQTTFPEAFPVFAYFVNGISKGKQTTPYSFIATPPSGQLLGENEILLGQWVADDLGAIKGDSITLRYFVLKDSYGLVEEHTSFVVSDIVEQNSLWSDSTLMPQFPGLADAGSCSDWDPGTAINLDHIRAKDEQYWDTWRGSPKAFVGLATAQHLWSNRFGSCTAIRIPADSILSIEKIQKQLHKTLGPSSAGLDLYSIRQEFRKSVSQGTSFTPLFIGLSFFLITAAAILTALLFSFSLQSRTDDYRVLASCGYTRNHLNLLFMSEGFAAAFIGACAGTLLSPVYTTIMLSALQTIWYAAAQTPSLNLHIGFEMIASGACTTLLIAGITMWFSVQSCTQTLFLQRHSKRSSPTTVHTRANLWLLVTGVFASAAIILLISVVSSKGYDAAGIFFGAGSLILIAMLSLFNYILMKINNTHRHKPLSLLRFALTNIARRKDRAIANAALFACALFLLGGISVFRHGKIQNPRAPHAGTGGFLWYGETLTGFSQNDLAQRSPSPGVLKDSGVFAITMRLRDGNDASCFNLNRVQTPPILGIKAHVMDSLNRFTFAKLSNRHYSKHPWQLLQTDMGEHVVPGFADQSVIEWGLGMSLGDTLHFVNESNTPLKIVLVGSLENSVFQGRILIDERYFIQNFPSTNGYRILLAESSVGNEKDLSQNLGRLLFDKGLDLELTATRLAAFNEVENTYLSIFSILGVLGLLLGSAGLGIVVIRNALERRQEFAVLRAQGYTQSHIRNLLLLEHTMIFVAGTLAGCTASLCAIFPSLIASHHDFALTPLLLTVGAVLVSGFASTWFAASVGSSGDILLVLRNE